MPVTSLKWQLIADAVRETPDQQGVFALWREEECVYVGHTPWNTTLRDRLREHLFLRDRGVIDASHYTWEVTPMPKTRQGDMVAAWESRHGEVPRYNRPDSPLGPVPGCITDLRARL